MAKEVNVKVNVDAKEADKAIDGLTDSVDGLGEAVEGVKTNTDGLSGGLEKAGKTGKKGLKSVATGFKGVGTAIKAAGIGLVIGLFAALKAILEKQQPVLDLVDTTMTAIGLAINEVGDALSVAFKSASDATGGFDAMKKVVSSLLTLALTPLKLSFFGIKAAVLEAQLIWEESFLGKGDPQEIKRLNTALDETSDSIKQVALDAVGAGGAIVDNIGEALDEVKDMTNAVIEETKKIDGARILSDAKRATRLKNAAELAEAQNKLLFERFDKEAEAERQTRDNQRLSFKERKEASDKLKVILEKQEAQQIKLNKINVAAAKAAVATNNSIENQKALILALGEEEAILADIKGRKTEQQEQAVALDLEEVDSKNALIESELQLALVGVESEEKKLQATIDSNKKKMEVFEEAGFTETQGYRDLVAANKLAEEEKVLAVKNTNVEKEKEAKEASDKALVILDELLKSQQELEIKAIDDAATAKIKALQDAGMLTTEAEAAIEQERIDAIKLVKDTAREEERQKDIAAAQENLALANGVVSDLSSIADNLAEITNNRIAREESALQTKAEQEIALNGKVSANTLVQQKKLEAEKNKVLEKAFKRQQQFAIAQALIDGSSAVMRILADTPKVDLGVATAIQIGLAAATTAASIAAIKSRKFSGAGGGSAPVADVSAPEPSISAPEFEDSVGAQLFETDATQIGSQAGQNQVRAYVTERDITDTQNRISTFEERSTLN